MGVTGNEIADETAKAAAERRGEEVADPTYLRGASLSHLTRGITEARTEATSEWIRGHVGQRQRHRPPKGGRMRKALGRARKELEGRFYQLLSGHAAVGERLRRVGQTTSDLFWWCGSGESQTRYHLFVKCQMEPGDQATVAEGQSRLWVGRSPIDSEAIWR